MHCFLNIGSYGVFLLQVIVCLLYSVYKMREKEKEAKSLIGGKDKNLISLFVFILFSDTYYIVAFFPCFFFHFFEK